jgi:hypothetical protein
MNYLSIIIGLVGFLFMGAIGQCQNRIAVSSGQKIHQITNQVSAFVQTIQGNDMEVKSNVTLAVDLEVKKDTPNIELSNTITRLQLQTEAMGNSILFDSDIKENREGQIGQILNNLIGKPFDATITVNGILFKSDKNKSEKDMA